MGARMSARWRVLVWVARTWARCWASWHRRAMRFSCVVFALSAGMVTAPSMAPASSAKAPTHMYRGTKSVGLIRPGQIGAFRAEGWDIECPAAEGSFLTRGRSVRDRTRINVHFWDGAVVAISRRQSAGRWVIYDFPGYGQPARFAGFAVRRSSTRWDVFRGQRKVGYTIGPDGPPAATALLMVCA
jgi:hypothetical protein